MTIKDRLRVQLATDASIRKTSKGEITNFGTFNFKFNVPRPIDGGLYCQKTFGPMLSHTCGCKWPRRMQSNEKACPKCSVVNGPNSIRRSREGHLELRVPYVNPMIIPLISSLFNLNLKNTKLILSGKLKFRFEGKAGGSLIAKNGLHFMVAIEPAEHDDGDSYDTTAVHFIRELERIDIDSTETMMKGSHAGLRQYNEAGFGVFDLFNTAIRVKPAGLRDLSISNNEPTFAPINTIYTRLVRSSIRIKLLLDGKAGDGTADLLLIPEAAVIHRLVESLYLDGMVDYRGNEVPSIMDGLKEKEGLFRGTAFGKRVDFSGRSVIISNPLLPLDTLGVPFKMMYELLKPDIISYVAKQIKETTKGRSLNRAAKYWESRHSLAINACWVLFEDERLIMNRAPSLHRYSVLGFKVKMHQGKSIELPPMLCTPFNADYDGDQMAVHRVLSDQARTEDDLISVESNLMSSIDWDEPLLAPSHEQIVGLYAITA